MPDFPPRLGAAFQNSNESWLSRVCGNARQLAQGTQLKLSDANDALVYFADLRTGPRFGRAQTASALTHAAIMIALTLPGRFIPRHPNLRARRGDSSRQLTPLSPICYATFWVLIFPVVRAAAVIATLFPRPPGVFPHFRPYNYSSRPYPKMSRSAGWRSADNYRS